MWRGKLANKTASTATAKVLCYKDCHALLHSIPVSHMTAGKDISMFQTESCQSDVCCFTATTVTVWEPFKNLLWLPCVADADIIFLPCGLFLRFFPRVISAVADWMSAILLHMVRFSANLECRSEIRCTRLAGNTGCNNDAKNRHLRTIAQVCRAISSQLRHVLTIRKGWTSAY